jgi:hypothetical protein
MVPTVLQVFTAAEQTRDIIVSDSSCLLSSSEHLEYRWYHCSLEGFLGNL